MRRTQSDSSELSREFVRPLSEHRQKKVAQIKHWFNAHSYQPKNALVSSAKRTAKTYDLFQVENCPTFFQNLFILPRNDAADCLEKGTQILISDDQAQVSDLRSSKPFAQRLVGKPRI